MGDVETALAELRETFPLGGVVSISTQQPPEFGITVFTPTGIVFQGTTLAEAMQKVREWKDKQ